MTINQALAWCDIFTDALDAGYTYEQAQSVADDLCMMDLAPAVRLAA